MNRTASRKCLQVKLSYLQVKWGVRLTCKKDREKIP